MNDLELFEEQERIKLKVKKEYRDKELNEWASAIGIVLFIFLFMAFLSHL